MSNSFNKNFRQTEMVFLNESDQDITNVDLQKGYPLVIHFNKEIKLIEFRIKKTNILGGKYLLIKKSKTDYELKFDIIKKGHGVVLIAIHNSKKHMDIVWHDIKISGTFKNLELIQDDFSDQMVYRASRTYLPIWIGAILFAIVFAFTFKTFFIAAKINLPFVYLFIGGMILSYFFVPDYFLSKVGNERYKTFWRLINASRKNNN